MLAKYANPSCNAKFKYLRDARLFEFNVVDGVRYNTIPLHIGAGRERLWLCEQCSRVLTLQCTEEGNIVPVSRIAREQRVAEQAAGARPQGGLLGNRVSAQPEARNLCPEAFYCPLLAGGMIPFMRKYSTIWP
jgi:hypothetical protein